jgi:lysophospholipase L1-like esterase
MTDPSSTASRSYRSAPLGSNARRALRRRRRLREYGVAEEQSMPKPISTALAVTGGVGAPRAAPTSAPGAGRRILLIGDSFAEGIGPPLAKRAAVAGLPFRSFGVKSTAIGDWLSGANLQSALTAADPTLTLVSLGANGMGGGEAEGRRAGQLIDALRRNGSAAVAWIAPPSMPKENAPFRATLAAECAKRDVRIFDTPSVLPDLERAPGDFHPTPSGYRVWANAVANWVPFGEPVAPAGGPIRSGAHSTDRAHSSAFSTRAE